LDDPENQLPHQNIIIRRQHITNKQRQDIYEELLARSANGILHKDTIAIILNLFHVKRRTIQNIWKKVKRCRAAGTAVDLVSKKAKNYGRKRVDIDLL
jgi:hypothetical protein